MKIAMYDLEGYLLEVFDIKTIVDLENDLKISKGSLNGCLSGKLNQTSNRQFRKVTDNAIILNRIGNVSNIVKPNHNLPIAKYYKGKFIKSYDSATEAASINNLDVTYINKCLNDKIHNFDNFEWKYLK